MSNETTLDDVLALVPTNWCDPILTGPDAVLTGKGGTWGCPDVERLLWAVRKRLADSPELRAALEDARRYRKMRDDFIWTLTSGTDGSRLSVYMMGVHLSRIGPDSDEFDAAIDAAQEVGK